MFRKRIINTEEPFCKWRRKTVNITGWVIGGASGPKADHRGEGRGTLGKGKEKRLTQTVSWVECPKVTTKEENWVTEIKRFYIKGWPKTAGVIRDWEGKEIGGTQICRQRYWGGERNGRLLYNGDGENTNDRVQLGERGLTGTLCKA